MDFEEEHLVDARGLLEFLGGVFASGSHLDFQRAGVTFCGFQCVGEGGGLGLIALKSGFGLG
jgi:hypothetical protein